MEAQPGGASKLLAGLAQGVFRRALEGLSVFVKEGAKHRERGNFGKGVNEGGGISRYHIKVRAAGADKGE